MKTATLFGLLSLLGGVAAQEPFWVVRHAPLLTTRLDPVVSPGGISGHMHSIVGGSGFAPVYEYDKLIQSKCTTANLDNDKSNYWVPQLYRKSANGTLTIAPFQGAATYYQTRRTGKEKVYEFPPAFRMLAGDPKRTSLDTSDPAQDAIRYVCLGKRLPESHAFPTENCPGGLRAQAYFPHCWDGVHAWLEGSKHVAYGEGRFDGGGKCPDTHPYRIMGLFYEFFFKDDYAYEPGARVWATGDTLGYSFHADFQNGWPVGLFKEIFDQGSTCSVGFSLENCPPLARHMTENGASCSPEGVRVDEDEGYSGLAQLPGNNPLYTTTLPAKDANYVETAKLVSIAPTAPAGWDLKGCIAEVDGRALRGASLMTDNALTPERCLKYCADQGFPLVGIEFGSECYCAQSLSNGAVETPPASARCDMNCPGMRNSKGMCGGPRAISLYRWTGEGASAVVEGGKQTIDPAPIRIPAVRATELRANHAKEDPDYPAGNIVTTLPGGDMPPATQISQSQAQSQSKTSAATTSTSANSSGGAISSTSSTSTSTSASASASVGTGNVLIPVPTSRAPTSATTTSTSARPTKTSGSCNRSRKRSIFSPEQICVETEEGEIVCGLQV